MIVMSVRIYDAEKGENGGVLWPEFRPAEWLAEKKRNMPRGTYNAQYRNDPSGLRGVRYDTEWLEYYLPSQLPPLSEMVGFQGGDPATSENLKADYFGHCTVGKHVTTGVTYVLGMDYTRKPATDHHEYLKSQFLYWTSQGLNIQSVRVESNGPQQGTVQRIIADARMDPDFPMPIEAYKPVGSKVVRFDSLIPHYQNGNLVFLGDATGEQVEMSERTGFKEFLEEFQQFPLGTRDDVFDALYIAAELCLQGVLAAVGSSDGYNKDETRVDRAKRLLEAYDKKKKEDRKRRDSDSSKERVLKRNGGRGGLFHSRIRGLRNRR